MNNTHHNLKETQVWADVQEAAGHGGACAAGTSNFAAACAAGTPNFAGSGAAAIPSGGAVLSEGTSNHRAGADGGAGTATNKAAASILRFCSTLQERVCNSVDCEHPGGSCEAAGCDNRICKVHERYCTNCELRYCEDCYEPHLEGCCGRLPDAHDAAVEQALSEGRERQEDSQTPAKEARWCP